MNSLESILNNFEKLIEQEFELEAKLTEKSFLIESHQQTAKQLNANSSESSESRKRKRIIDAEEELQDQQLTKFKKLRSDSLNLVNLEDKLDELKEIMITSMNKITSMPQNNQGVIIHGNSNQFLNLRLSNNIMNVTTYEEENEARLSENDIDTANYEEVSEAIEAIGFL